MQNVFVQNEELVLLNSEREPLYLSTAALFKQAANIRCHKPRSSYERGSLSGEDSQ